MYVVIIHDNDENIYDGVFGPFESEEDAIKSMDQWKDFGEERHYYVSLVEVANPDGMSKYWDSLHEW